MMIELNGRTYRLPEHPTVVICADGCDPSYIEAGLAASDTVNCCNGRVGRQLNLKDVVSQRTAADGE